MSSFKYAMLGAVSALGFVANAQAQTVDEVIVTARRPIAESVAAALQVQRASDSLVSVLSADAVGNLPDQNVAFAVGRLPGVGVQRDQGQARYINLRGAPVYWTTLSFDGLSVVSPQGRESRIDNIPSAIASQIIVQKAIVPSMPGDTVAGNVNIRSRRAFDYPGSVTTGKLGYGYVQKGGGKEIDGSLVTSNIFMDGKLGIVAQASYYQRQMATDNWETDPYLSNTVAPDKHFAREHENKHYRLTRENFSASLRADYKIDDTNTIFASTINTLYHDDELRDNFIFRLDQGTDAAGNGYTSTAYINANDPTFGTSYGARINARVDYRDSEEWMSTNTLGGEHSWSGFDVSWRLNHTWTNDGRNAPVTLAFQGPSTFNLRPTVEYDLRNGDVNTVKLFATGGTTTARTRGAQITDIETFAFPLTTAGKIEGGDITMANTGKVDIDYAGELFDHATKFEFGGIYTQRTKKSRETNWSANFSTGTIPTWATFATNNPGYLGDQNLNYTFRYTNQGLTSAFVQNLADTGVAVKQDTRGNYFKVTEDLAAIYAMATTNFDWGNLVYGVRAEHIKNTGEAFVAFPATGTTPAQTRLVQTDSSATLFYPSIHANFNLTDQIKLRVSGTSSASRPDYDDLRPNFTINDSTQSISGGNPEAKPEKQMGLDTYLEWYMTPSGFFSAGLFYKDIKDVLVQRSSLFGLDTLDLPGLDRSSYNYTGVGNGGAGHLQGFEIYYAGNAESMVESVGLPAWLGGFGVAASGTFTASEVSLPSVNGVPERKISLLGSSDAVYNLQAIYEKYGLSVRLAYQYRTPWGESVGAYRMINGGVYAVDNGDIFWDADEEIDLSIRYQVNKTWELFFDGLNLGAMGARRYGDKERYPIEFEKFGPRYIGGFRFNF